MDLYSSLATAFSPRSAQPWVILPDDRVRTYAEVDAVSAQVAGLLRTLGVRAGDRVAVQVDKSPEALLAYLGIVRMGAALVPLNPGYRPDELSHLLGDAAPAVAVGRPGDPSFPALARAGGCRDVLDLGADGAGSWSDAVAAAVPWDDPPAPDDDDLAALVYTSGTTGRSKGAMLSHRNLVSNAVTLHDLWGFRDGDVLVHALPIFHVHGLFVATNTAMLQAAPIRFHPRFDAGAVLDDLGRSTVFMGVPTMYVRLLAEPGLDADAVAGMRLFVSGSAPMLPSTIEAFRERTGHIILERYGMTETSMITSNPFFGVCKPGSVGPALPGVSVRVVDDADAAVVAGRVGEVQVQGPNVLRGYWRRPDRDAQDWTADGWFRTGDVGVLDDDGYLTLVGRSKDLVITGGYNVYPKELELLLDALPGVVESAVIGVAHPDLGEAVTAVLVAVPGAAPDPDDVLAALRPHLAGYKVPKAVCVVDDLPRNAMGKVLKNVLREQFAELYAAP